MYTQGHTHQKFYTMGIGVESDTKRARTDKKCSPLEKFIAKNRFKTCFSMKIPSFWSNFRAARAKCCAGLATNLVEIFPQCDGPLKKKKGCHTTRGDV